MSYIPLHAWPETYRGCSFHPIHQVRTSEHVSSCCVVYMSCKPGNIESRSVCRHMSDSGEGQGQGCQWSGTALTSAEETRLSARDRFTPVTQPAEVRRPRQQTNEKWHFSEIPAVVSFPSGWCISPTMHIHWGTGQAERPFPIWRPTRMSPQGFSVPALGHTLHATA